MDTATEPVACEDVITELQKGRERIEGIEDRLENVEMKVDVAIEHSAHCLRDTEFELIKERLGNIFQLASDTNKCVQKMTAENATLEAEMKTRVEQNGKQDVAIEKLTEDKSEIEVQIQVLDTKMDNLADYMKTIVTILKGIGIGLAIMIISFFIKTIFFGI